MNDFYTHLTSKEDTLTSVKKYSIRMHMNRS